MIILLIFSNMFRVMETCAMSAKSSIILNLPKSKTKDKLNDKNTGSERSKRQKLASVTV